MYRLDEIEEIKFINHLISGFKKSPLQMNRIHTSDSEIIMLDGMDKLIAVTTDGISEELDNYFLIKKIFASILFFVV